MANVFIAINDVGALYRSFVTDPNIKRLFEDFKGNQYPKSAMTDVTSAISAQPYLIGGGGWKQPICSLPTKILIAIGSQKWAQNKSSPSCLILLTGQNAIRLSEQDFNGIMEILRPHSSKWKPIGQGLGFTPTELSNIEATLSLLLGAPASFLDKLLADWLQWAPGDARGSRGYATMQSLSTAVSKAGLGVVAEQLSSLHIMSSHHPSPLASAAKPISMHIYDYECHTLSIQMVSLF